MTTDHELDLFLATTRPALERALTARWGLPAGADAAADALEYAVRNWQRMSAMQNPAGYLFRVGCSRARRDHARRKRELVAQPAMADAPLDIDLQRALMKLKWEQRVAIILVHGHGHTYASAAELLDVPVTTITNHINRGLARLRTLLEER